MPGIATNDEWVLKGINLTVPMGSRMRWSVNRLRKSTIAHLLLGLLQPELENLSLMAIRLPTRAPAWQANCAMVPQNIQLLIRVSGPMLPLALMMIWLMMTGFGSLYKPLSWPIMLPICPLVC